jgi:D-alanyl-D-alanine carboxypeptidase
MKRIQWKKAAAAVLALAFALAGVPPQQVQAKDYWPKAPKVSSESAILMEVNTGTVLYEKNSHDKQYPASITKIMTCLLAIENCDLDEIVTFSEDAVYKNEGDTSNIARSLGEELTVEQCLYAVMLESANECAYALGEHVGEKLGGDYRTFIDLMNTRAKELGCTDTHFNNANGLPDEDHWVSAYDMALISAEAYKNSSFRRIAGADSYTIPKTNKCKVEYPCHNHHKMIYPYKADYSHLYEYCTGGKTGYTVAARSTLVSYAEKDGITLVCVVLRAESPAHYTDTRKLFDYGFDNFQALSISENDTTFTQQNQRDFGLLNNNDAFVTLEKNAYLIMPKAAEFADAGVSVEENSDEDDRVARLLYTYADKEVGNVSIVKTGAKVTDNYFGKNEKESTENENVIVIQPHMIFAGVLCVAGVVLLLLLAHRFYDQFYLMRHMRQMRRIEKNRFKEKKTKKRYRKRDRMFK